VVKNALLTAVESVWACLVGEKTVGLTMRRGYHTRWRLTRDLVRRPRHYREYPYDEARHRRHLRQTVSAVPAPTASDPSRRVPSLLLASPSSAANSGRSSGGGEEKDVLCPKEEECFCLERQEDLLRSQLGRSL